MRSRLTRELDERDAFIAKEAEKASKGLPYRRLPPWANDSFSEALNFPDVADRHMRQMDEADKMLPLIREARKERKTLQQISNAKISIKDIKSRCRPAPSANEARDMQPKEAQSAQSAPGPVPKMTIDAIKSRYESALRVSETRDVEPNPKGVREAREHGDQRGRGDIGGSRHSDDATQAQPKAYPAFWSRWQICSDITHLIGYIDGHDGMKFALRVEKLEPKTYGGDVYHDLGLCKKHFTAGPTCPFGWEECPFRHWAIEQFEEAWVDPNWLASVRRMDRGPSQAPDHPLTRYLGRERILWDGRSVPDL